jgi:hypothetical protein
MILLMSLEETTILRTRRAILEAPLKRMIRIIIIVLMVVIYYIKVLEYLPGHPGHVTLFSWAIGLKIGSPPPVLIT